MMFGTTIDEDTSFALLDRFVEEGGVWIDPADCYAFWASDSGHGGAGEALLGRWLAARPGVRDRVRISTKLGAEPRWRSFGKPAASSPARISGATLQLAAVAPVAACRASAFKAKRSHIARFTAGAKPSR